MLHFLPEALAEVEDATKYYEQIVPGLGVRFRAEIERECDYPRKGDESSWLSVESLSMRHLDRIKCFTLEVSRACMFKGFIFRLSTKHSQLPF